MKKFEISTHGREALIDITPQVRSVIAESGVTDGLCVVFCPHTTGAITINENADPDVPRDVFAALERAFPWEGNYRHTEGNSAAHVKSSLVGASCHLLVEGAAPVLGRWQSVFFCEFDGPRRRTFFVQVIPA